jgi:hypothetical protein
VIAAPPPTVLVWHLTTRGFGSEINTLLLAKAYARARGFQFVLCSQRWNARFERGWGDYFEPSDREIVHPDPVDQESLRAVLTNKWQRRVLFQSDVWSEIWTQRFPSYPLIDPRTNRPANDFWTAIRAEMAQVWRPSAAVLAQVARHQAMISKALGLRYSAVHIRRGDKTLEAPNTTIDSYLRHLTQPELPRHVFVMTDDFSVIEELRAAVPEFVFASLCLPSQQGHEQIAFNSQTASKRYEETVRLIAELLIAANAERFFGTGTSNISRVLALLRGVDRVDSIDGPLDFFYLAP